MTALQTADARPAHPPLAPPVPAEGAPGWRVLAPEEHAADRNGGEAWGLAIGPLALVVEASRLGGDRWRVAVLPFDPFQRLVAPDLAAAQAWAEARAREHVRAMQAGFRAAGLPAA